VTAPTLPLAELTVVTEPGVYPDMSAEQYHADPALSSSGARTITKKSPAHFHYERMNGRPPKPEFDIGHAAHKLALGAGSDIVIVEAKDWRTKEAQKARDAAHDAGKTPLLPKAYAEVEAMAAVLKVHPATQALFGGNGGRPEQSLFWVDRPTGIMRRARLDWFPVRTAQRMVIPDYKTAVSAHPDAFSRVVETYGYHQQAAWYLDAVQALGLAGADAAFVFVVQEKTPPYVVSVFQPTLITIEIGRRLNREAIETYRDCTESGRWPGYSDEVEPVSLPPWAENRELEDFR
jgi:hypothetical protein